LTAEVSRTPLLARRFFDRFEPVHAVTYFAPEVQAGLAAMGFTGFWRGYFAARSAPLGQVPAEVVTAVFYNFSAERVRRMVPAVWEVATPALVAEGIGGRKANVLHVAAGAVPAAFIKRSRDYTDAEWHSCTESLVARGFLTPQANSLSRAGRSNTASRSAPTPWR
jgi:hypothetical protein